MLEHAFRGAMMAPADALRGRWAHLVALWWRLVGNPAELERVRALLCYCSTAPKANPDWPCWVCAELAGSAPRLDHPGHRPGEWV